MTKPDHTNGPTSDSPPVPYPRMGRGDNVAVDPTTGRDRSITITGRFWGRPSIQDLVHGYKFHQHQQLIWYILDLRRFERRVARELHRAQKFSERLKYLKRYRNRGARMRRKGKR